MSSSSHPIEITSNAALVARSLASVWHPCTQMKHHEQFPLVPMVCGEGAWLIDVEGKRYLDAVSSWWVNLFGHANPRINAAIKDQLDTLEHVMLAGFTHEPAVQLAERLAKLTGLGHAFYASDGASAVEIALKMSFHFWRNHGKSGKQKFVSLEGSYHGETMGALAVTDVAIFRDAYGPLLKQNLLVPTPHSPRVPQTPLLGRVSSEHGPNAAPIGGFQACCPECAIDAAHALERLFIERADEIAAFIVEPLVQGAAGLRMYHPDYLRRARALCDQYHVHFIADEIMTGFGRTGTMFACEQANVKPDFMCLSKGLTGGYLPLSCVLTTDNIYEAFYDDDVARAFLHSHSYTGSALACRAALATLDIFAADNVIEKNRATALRWNELARPITQHPRVKNFRHLGMIWAFEVESENTKFAKAFFAEALALGVLLRPIGNTVYFMPPYVVSDEEFAGLVTQTLIAIDKII
jgi:adenosylmethionine---8-amino-7-oxononanoate aminotransferase